jgi:hypothetical protein
MFLGFAQLGIGLLKCIDLRPNLQVQNLLESLPKIPIAQNRWCVLSFFDNLKFFILNAPDGHLASTFIISLS